MGMKRIGFTQRVFLKEAYGERWDACDQKVAAFLQACGCIPVPIPNNLSVVKAWMAESFLDGAVLTGGNDLSRYGGDAPERDAVERFLLETFLGQRKPVYGFCRGMQMILDYFGAPLVQIPGHVAVRHMVHGHWGAIRVNSYHAWGARAVAEPLRVLMRAEDGTVEAVCVQGMPVLGTMWHPEREHPFCGEDLDRVRSLLGDGKV